jgi:hypothetical protein
MTMRNGMIIVNSPIVNSLFHLLNNLFCCFALHLPN